MDWTEGEARLATLEREVTRHQRLAREQQALTRDDGRVAAVARGPRAGAGSGAGTGYGDGSPHRPRRPRRSALCERLQRGWPERWPRQRGPRSRTAAVQCRSGVRLVPSAAGGEGWLQRPLDRAAAGDLDRARSTQNREAAPT